MKSAGHVARMGENRGACSILVRRPEGRNRLEDPDVDGRIILKLSFKSLDEGHRLD